MQKKDDAANEPNQSPQSEPKTPKQNDFADCRNCEFSNAHVNLWRGMYFSLLDERKKHEAASEAEEAQVLLMVCGALILGVLIGLKFIDFRFSL